MRPRPRHEQGVGGHSVGRSEAGGGPLPRAEAVAPSRERACGAAARQPGARRRQRRTLLCAGTRFLAHRLPQPPRSPEVYIASLPRLCTPYPRPLPPLRFHLSTWPPSAPQDWWFAAPLELALTFGAIGERFAWYEARSIALGFKLTGENLWSHMAWPIHIHDALNGSAALRFVRWHGALGRHVYRSLLMNSPGTVDIVKAVPTFSEVRIGGHGGIGGACDEQSFDPGVLLRSPAQDLQLRRSQVVRPDLAKTFSGRFRSMAQMCLPLP